MNVELGLQRRLFLCFLLSWDRRLIERLHSGDGIILMQRGSR